MMDKHMHIVEKMTKNVRVSKTQPVRRGRMAIRKAKGHILWQKIGIIRINMK